MNTLTIETTTGAATLSAGALEITNDIIPFKVSFTTGGVDSTTNVAQLGYSDLGLGVRLGSQAGRLLASSRLWEVSDGAIRMSLVIGDESQKILASSVPVSVHVEVALSRSGYTDAKYYAACTAAIADSTTAATSAVLAHNGDAAAHLSIQRRTLTGNLVLTAADLPQQRIIPDADRDVTLPAEGAAQWLFEICHGGAAYVVTVKRASGTAVATLIVGSVVVVSWDGVAFESY